MPVPADDLPKSEFSFDPVKPEPRKPIDPGRHGARLRLRDNPPAVTTFRGVITRR